MRRLQVSLEGRSYPIYIGRNLYPHLWGAWQESVKPTKILLVSDENVFPLFGGKLIAELDRAGFASSLVVVPAGEGSKSMSWLEAIYSSALEAGLDRGGLVLALGGGVVGDLAGFAAATYMRGVPFIQVPTTLLAQVDSSVGGKVAVNHPLGKNLIGAFYQPRLVWIELETLRSLPEREFLAGAAEVIKYGIILSKPFFNYLEENWTAFLARQEEVLTEVIAVSCGLKSEVVARDEREEGERAILNFGHTWGHALEAATGYNYYLHGEAVLVGMALAVHMAAKKKILSRTDARRIVSMLARIGLRPPPPGLDSENVLASLKYDKKRKDGRLVFVFPVSIGEVALFSDTDTGLLFAVLNDYLCGWLEKEYS
ncbi:MAG: 3-dehydroquinate synthase [Dethiobacter sp.]|jgi:3-dehydroquinate synthase|nr:3-dehydroquinate synthase [Dethiobacter sp.]